MFCPDLIHLLDVKINFNRVSLQFVTSMVRTGNSEINLLFFTLIKIYNRKRFLNVRKVHFQNLFEMLFQLMVSQTNVSPHVQHLTSNKAQ